MNKRIQKLFNEAGFHQPEMERLGIEDKFEKFTELIVKECAEWLKQPVNQTPLSGAVMNIAADRLKEHFGVEE